MPQPEHRRPVTLEQLLQLKRAERPAPEFWQGFEQELRQKQLAALLERRPWWQTLPQFLSRRAYLPIGATAVLAFTFVSVKYYGPREVAPDMVADHSVALSQPERLAAGAPQPVVSALAPTAVETNTVRVDDRTAVAATAVPLSERLPEQREPLTPWEASAGERPRISLASTFAQLPAAAQENPLLPEVTNVPTASFANQSAPVLELATVSAIASRRNRLLAELNDRRFQPEPQAPALVRERLARRLADQDFDDRFSRLGLKGDQVSLKF